MLRLNGGQTTGKGSFWMILLSPFFGLLFVCLIPFVSMLVTMVFLTRIASAGALSSDEAGMCMGCHSTQGVIKTFKNGEKLSVHLGEKHFKDSVHSFLGCTDCHNDISMDKHPSAQYSSKREFSLQVSSACRNCHTDEQILKKPLHQHAVTRANAPPCSECHGSHSILKSSGWKEKASNSHYCLTCHKQELKISLNGEILSLTIDEEVLGKSVHSNHNCSDCHVGFSKNEHPIKKFASRRHLSVEMSGVCRRCHSEKYTQFEGSIHFSMLKEGNLKAPVCTDCHGAHSVGPKAIADTMDGVPCRRCHENTFEEFKGSVHGMAKTNGKDAAPLCSSCHFAHEVKPAVLSRSPKATCIACHKNAEYAHDQWLPNAGIHLEAVACTVCHVPDVGHRIYLSIIDRDSGEVISELKVKELLGADYGMLQGYSDAGIEGKQLWDIYRRLNDKAITVSMKGMVGIQDSVKSHCVADKSKALRQCDTCHNAQSDSFKAVSLSVMKGDGREEFYNVSPKALGSIFSVLPLNQFYALGSTRVKMLDFLGIFMVFASASFPAVHITMRILTRWLRASKKHKGTGR